MDVAGEMVDGNYCGGAGFNLSAVMYGNDRFKYGREGGTSRERVSASCLLLR